MRKDVKLGLSVGAVLFACIIVYLVVAGHKKNGPGDQLVDNGQQAMSNDRDNSTPDTPAPPVDPQVANPTPATPTPRTPDNTAGVWNVLKTGGTPPPLENTGNSGIDHSITPLVDPAPVFAIHTPTTVPSVTSVNGSRTHVVQSGETLSSIARAEYGRATWYTLLAKANPGINPTNLKVGSTITIPEAPARSSSPVAHDIISARESIGAISPETTLATNEYRIKGGDSLYAICFQKYGRGDRVDEVYELNRKVIGPDKRSLKIGTVIKLPEARTVSASR